MIDQKSNFDDSQEMKDFNSRIIVVKRMGDLDITPFVNAMKRKFAKEEAKEKTLELYTVWENNLRDPNWHPFKVIITDENGKAEVFMFGISSMLILTKRRLHWFQLVAHSNLM